MKIYYDNCTDAVTSALNNKYFGVYHSTMCNPNLNIHTHECLEILICLKGGKNFLIDDKIYKVENGDLFVINQFEAHKITLSDDVERYTLQIHPEFVFSLSSGDTDLSMCFYVRGEGRSNKIHLDEEKLKNVITMLKSFEEGNAIGTDCINTSEMTKLLVYVNRWFSENKPETKLSDERVSSAVRYINDHISEELTLEMIAKNSFMSVNRLCKVFKSSLGTTVMKYIIGKRISYAKKLLKNGNSVSDTAFKSGFHDYSNFIRTFTKAVGISPGKYKK